MIVLYLGFSSLSQYLLGQCTLLVSVASFVRVMAQLSLLYFLFCAFVLLLSICCVNNAFFIMLQYLWPILQSLLVLRPDTNHSQLKIRLLDYQFTISNFDFIFLLVMKLKWQSSVKIRLRGHCLQMRNFSGERLSKMQKSLLYSLKMKKSICISCVWILNIISQGHS